MKEEGLGALVLPLYREHVMQRGTKSLGPVEPTGVGALRRGNDASI